MAKKGNRIEREKRTVEAMIRIYCSHHHGPETVLCPRCRTLLEYAHARLDRCSFGDEKTTCAKCPVHCYKPSMREEVRKVMRYSGPRMIYHHPIMAVRHIRDGRRKTKKG
jgi:hypothetical protein